MRHSIVLALLAGCAPIVRPPVKAPAYAAVFDDLAAQIERDHVFAPGYVRDVGHPWRDDIPRLREAFVHASSKREALIALAHLQNSLRDPHCALDPPAKVRPQRVQLGVRLWAGGTAAAPEVRITEVLDPALAAQVTPGDAVVSVDGEPLARWIGDHPFESSWLAPAAALRATVRSIVSASLPWSKVSAGDARVLGIEHHGQIQAVTMRFQGGFAAPSMPDLDQSPPMASIDCDALAPIAYGDYALSTVGVNVCIYEQPHARPRVPIVRWVSFDYGSSNPAQALRMARTDHDLLAHALEGADAVVLDLHENHGGNNPFVFLGWFAGTPWEHPRVVTHVGPDLDTASADEVFFGDDAQVRAYAEAKKAGRGRIESCFLCGGSDGSVRSSPERVTRAKVALIVGPDCASSCDSLAVTWSAYRLGPIVGQQPAHVYTVNRLPIHVVAGDEDLGTLRLALSSSLLNGHAIEGEPIRLDWETTPDFAHRTSWLEEAVAEAKQRLR